MQSIGYAYNNSTICPFYWQTPGGGGCYRGGEMQADELVMQPKKKRGRPRKVLGVRGAMADRTRLQRASLHERATEKLRSLIVRGDLAPESVLVESSSATCSACRGPRCARLSSCWRCRAGRAAPEPQRTHTSDPRGGDPRSVRGGERHRAGRRRACSPKDHAGAAGQPAPPAGRDRASVRPGDLQAYFTVNQEIHRAIVAAGQNAILCETHDWLFGRAERRAIWPSPPRGAGESRWREERAILAALAARDADAAGRLLGDHVLRTGSEVIEVLRPSAAA